MTFFMFSLFISNIAFHAHAQDGEELNTTIWGYDTAWLTLKRAAVLDIHIEDQIEDGCWTDLSGAKNAVELQLIRSGYETQNGEEGSVFIPDVVLNAVGYEIQGLGICAASLILKVQVPDFAEYATDEGVLSSLYSKTVATYQVVITAKKSSANSMIKREFEGMAQNFLVDIDRAKRQMRIVLEDQDESPANQYWIQQLR